MQTCKYALLLGAGILLMSAPASSAALVHEWSRSAGGTYVDESRAIAVDASGNVVVTGHFMGTVDFGGGALTSVHSRDMFLARYDAGGAHQWSHRFGGTAYDEGETVAVDASGGVVLGGYFTTSVDFGGGVLTSAGGLDACIARFDANGVHQWSRRFGGSGYDVVEAVAVDVTGNVIVAGYFNGTVDFGGGALTSAGGGDVFVAKFDADGMHQWSERFGESGDDHVGAIAVDASGNVTVAGMFRGTAGFGGSSFTSSGGEDIFVAQYDDAGVYRWSRGYGGAIDDYARAVAVDASGNVTVVGQFADDVDFGGGTLTGWAGSYDAFVASYDVDGAYLWSRRMGHIGSDAAWGVAADPLGNVTVSGQFSGTVDFGGGNLTSAGSLDIFLARYDANGVHQWSQRFGGADAENGAEVALDASGGIAITGDFYGSVDFGGGDLTAAGASDIFLARFNDEQPVAVLFDAFDATLRHNAVDLTWSLQSDEGLDRFILYRREGSSPAVVVAEGDARTTRSYSDRSVESGKQYGYELVVRTLGGSAFSSPVVTVTVGRIEVALHQNVPNPFNPQTRISFTLPVAGPATLSIYDVDGRLVRTLLDRPMEAGDVSVTWDGKDAGGIPMSSGIYFCRLQAAQQTFTRKMLLLK